jgi:hypothetical protein
MRFGWALNPHFSVGMHFEELKRFARDITAEQKRLGDKTVAQRLHRLLFRCSFSPHLRAYQVVRASRLPFLEEFSHHLEVAHFHYFKSDYLSAVLTLLPAIEGTLREHASETVLAVLSAKPDAAERIYGRDDANVPELIGAIKLRPLPSPEPHDHDYQRCRLNRDLLFDVLMKWIYRPMRDAERARNFEITHLNRNGAQHLFNHECFYTQADAERLFLIMDLYIEAVRHEFMVPTSSFLPGTGEDPRVDVRSSYYVGLLLGALPIGACLKIERSLLAEHKNFTFVQDFEPTAALVEDAEVYQRTLREITDKFRRGQGDGTSGDHMA